MKKLLMVLRVIVVVFAMTGCRHLHDISKKQNGMDDGLIAYYPFNGNALDASANHYDGIVNGATLTSDKNGNKDSAFLFNGTTDSIFVPVNINPHALPVVTITAWVRADRKNPVRQVVSNDNGGFDRSMGIDFRGGGNGWSAFSGTDSILGFQPVVIGDWVFLAVVYDQPAGTVKLYVNNNVIEGHGAIGAGRDALLIGASPGFGEYFSGAIDEVRIYNRVLTQSDLQDIVNL
jgi:hypothetical protein